LNKQSTTQQAFTENWRVVRVSFSFTM